MMKGDLLGTTDSLAIGLIGKFPDLQKYAIDFEFKVGKPPGSEYTIFSPVVRPYLDDLCASHSESKLQAIWDELERIVKSGGEAARNGIFLVVAEELKTIDHCMYLGPALFNHWFMELAVYPKNLTSQYINHPQYLARRSEGIEKLGGRKRLDRKNANKLLEQEFKRKERKGQL